MLSLRPYQEVGAAFLAGRKAALLADEMRLGKCAQAISACDRLNALNVTVICPASVVENWRREFAKWSDRGRSLEVWSYDMAARGNANRWDGIDVLILDEAHYLKNHNAKRTKVIFGEKCDGDGGLIEQAKHVWLLTGTPMPNDPSELWPALRALAPETIFNPKSSRPYSFWQYVNKYCKTVDNGFGIKIVGGKNHDALKAKLDTFMLRRTLAEVKPEIPAITFDDLYVEGKTYDSEVRRGGDGCFYPSREVELIRRTLEEKGVEGLREIAPQVATLRRYTGMVKVQGVVDWVREFLDNGGGKIVLFAHHREVIAQIRQHVGELHCCIDGSFTPEQRQWQVDMFNENADRRVFIGQIQAAGEGIDLSAADEMIFVESSWVPKDNAQAAWRIMNLAQGRPKLVRFATLAGSIDEQVSRAVRRKTIDIAKIFG